MNIEQIIAQLKSLREHCESMIDPEEQDSVWAADVEALDSALTAMNGVKLLAMLKDNEPESCHNK